jgi:hypothetical protein
MGCGAVSGSASWIPPDIDIERASPARVYDYLLGGALNFPVDRAMAQQAIQAMPWVVDLARYNRAFLVRAVRFCVSAGVRQFLDLGSGMPSVRSVHEVAQAIDPECRVVYVEREPVAVAHSRLILSAVEGAGVVGADMCDVDAVLDDPVTRELVDFTRPVAVVMASSLHYVLDDEQAVRTAAGYLKAVVRGSFFVLSHITDASDVGAREVNALVELSKSTSAAGVARSREWIAALLDGLDLVEPGLVYTSQWRPDNPLKLVTDQPAHAALLAAVARKP